MNDGNDEDDDEKNVEASKIEMKGLTGNDGHRIEEAHRNKVNEYEKEPRGVP